MGVISSVVGAVSGSNAAAKAATSSAGIQSAAIEKAINLQREMFNQTREDYAPFRETSQPNMNALQSMVYGNYDFKKTPAYKFQDEELTRSINREMAARGGYNSSGAVNALTRMRGGLLANEVDNQFNRGLSLVNINRGANADLTGQRQGMTNAISGMYQNQGNALAQGRYDSGMQKASMYSNLGNLPLNLMSMGMGFM